jgi:hypothetical protein
MVTPMTKQSDEAASLRAELDALKNAMKPADPAAEARAAADWQNEMHQMREGRMSQATPPSVVRDFAVLDNNLVKEVAMRDARAPAGPSSAGAIPSSQQISNIRGAGGGSGWAREVPLSNPPGTNYADRLMDEQDRRDRAERVAQHAQIQAMEKLAEKKP